MNPVRLDANDSISLETNSLGIQDLDRQVQELSERILQATSEDMSSNLEKFTTLLSSLEQLIEPSEQFRLRKKVENCFSRINKNSQVVDSQNTIDRIKNDNALQIDRLEKLLSSNNQVLKVISQTGRLGNDCVQIKVLNQHADGTSRGFENCGYHALKNALIALLPNQKAKDLEHLFNNKEFFLSFYKYCSQFTSSSLGNKDVTIVTVRDIIDHFSREELSEPALISLQQVLKNSLDSKNLAVYQVATSDGIQGTISMGFMDSQSVLEAQKLYEFAKKPGPATISCMIGNEALGHWNTLIIQKNTGGEYEFFGCDSIDDFHQILGGSSSLLKTAELLKLKLNHIENFMKEAFSPLEDYLSIRSNWLKSDEAILAEYKSRLLDETQLESYVIELERTFQMMNTMGWLKSDDYWSYLKQKDLEDLVQFYLEHLQSDHVLYSRLQQLSESLKSYQKLDFVNYTFSSILKEIEGLKEKVPTYTYSQFHSTFSFLQSLYREQDKFIGEENAEKRLDFMNAITGSSGVEEGFVLGHNKHEVQQSFIEKVNVLLLTYQMLKNQGNIDEMIKVIASGDGCLTARMARIIELYSTSQLGKIEENLSSYAKETASHVLSEIIGVLNKEDQKEFIQQVTFDEIIKEKDLFIRLFTQYCSGERTLRFRKFLRARIPTLDENHIDWSVCISSIAQVPEISQALESAKILALGNLE